ncbi:trihelix transcription factor GTL1 isoform X1 [Iris pallida]|uniref:Trihelix transcription factor GTL1 isoform X1 n=1 Tax=Iris pallida TaxID=29817 RepID=A0AAX6EUC2_IRIPA|nr:trihelix transcription factor GTL1 isoform X1 [Iris pallida]KAJ6807439.1 trihelix transcription factor GTL1 isoform X1 [Iris pallida]
MQQGGSPYGAPPPRDASTTHSFSPPSAAAAVVVPQQQQMADGAAESLAAPPSSSAAPDYEELGAAEADPLGADKGAAGGGGNRWPRQETLALLKIRSDMDATFREATLKGALWEEVSRKLAELGYVRSGKKCKEKFENVHKYYKRTKEGRAGRQDGKSYRFFSQLEALHGTSAAAESSHFTSPAAAALPITTTTAAAAAMGTATAAPVSAVTSQSPLSVAPRFGQTPPQQQQQQQISAPTPIATAPPMPMLGHEHQQNASSAMSFSSNTSSDELELDGDGGEEEEDDDEDDEATEEGPSSGKKRKRVGGAGGGRKMMALFEGLMRQVMERQEAMQQRFLEAIEKREQDRMVREEAWRRQEVGRLAREQELAAGERAAAAARDAAVISLLQKVTGQTVPIPSHAAPAPAPAPALATVSIVQTPPPLQIHPPQQLTPPASQPPQQHQPPPTPPPLQLQSAETARHQYHQQQQQTPPPPPMRPTSTELVPLPSDQYEGGATASVSLDPASSSRWPKPEVHALIKLRSGLDTRYQESGPKGPLWEEISAGMQRLGYNRSSKRCKEKWENINKYFKKVKESNKKRPEDAKTCPYFHQLDALYRNKLLSSGGSGGGGSMPALTNRPHDHGSRPNPSPVANPISVMPRSLQQQQLRPPMTNQGEMDVKKGSGPSIVGGMPTTFRFGDDSAGGNGDGSTSGIQKKPEDIVKELMGQSSRDYGRRLDEPDSDNMDEDDDEEDEEDEEDSSKGQYTIQFQQPNVGRGANANRGSGGASAAPPGSGGKAAGSFLAMVR